MGLKQPYGFAIPEDNKRSKVTTQKNRSCLKRNETFDKAKSSTRQEKSQKGLKGKKTAKRGEE
ncbi:MAG: hypothetical protein ACK5JU_03060 [Bacteroidales bacterium]